MNNSILELLNEKKQGVNVLCKHFNVTRSTIYQSISGYGSRQIRVEIALLLNKKPSELWTKNDSYALECDDALYASRCINAKIAQKIIARADDDEVA